MDIITLQRRLAPLLGPAGAAYGAAMRLRASRYASRAAAQYQAACPVVSVGNIAWGGTGKTPVVEYLLGKTAGLRTVVLTRGYKASPPELPFPVRPDGDPAQTGDEPLFLARRHPETLILVDPRRARAAAWAERHANPQLFLLDDGMQHLAMRRDLDIVLLRPDDLLGDWDRVIPAGTWREGKSALSRAHAFCMKADQETVANIIPVAEKRLASFGRPLFFFDLRPTGLIRLVPHRQTQAETAPDLGGSAYTLVCGTGNPDHVRKTAAKLLKQASEHEFIVADHHGYTEMDAQAIKAKKLPVVCTAKDAVKLARFLPAFGDIPVWVLDARATFAGTLFANVPFDIWWEENVQHLLTLQSCASPQT